MKFLIFFIILNLPFLYKSCEWSEFNNNENCISECPLNQYGDMKTGKCEICDNSCEKCLNLNMCISCKSSFLLNFKCENDCSDKYETKSNYCIKKCELGSTNYECIKNDLKCLAMNNDLNKYSFEYKSEKCMQCHPNCDYCAFEPTLNFEFCYTCSNISKLLMPMFYYPLNIPDDTLIEKFKTIKNDNSIKKFVFIGNCVDQMPPGWTIYQNITKVNNKISSDFQRILGKCPDNCMICMNTSKNGCLECLPNYILFDSLCYPDCDFTPSDSDCKKCGRNCAQCQRDDQLNTLACTKCKTNYTLSNFLFKGQCLKECPINTSYDYQLFECVSCVLNQTYIDTLNNTCVKCPNNCAECDLNGCNKCGEDYTIYNHGKQCCKNDKEIFNYELQQCESCPKNCLRCNNFDKKCNLCEPSYQINNIGCCLKSYWYDDKYKICLPCVANCDFCQNDQSCTKCMENYQTNNGGCCKEGYFFNKDNRKCELCLLNCIFCTSFDKCFQCKNDYFLSKEKKGCCLISQWFDSQLKLCKECPVGCLSCKDDGSETCFDCKTSYYLNNGRCCQYGFFYNVNIKKYEKCFNEFCDQCSNSSITGCLKCNSKYQLSNGVCCISGNYFDKEMMKCSNCSSHCLKCINNSYCNNCEINNDLNILNNFCCNEGEFYDESSGLCSQCIENCKKCIKSRNNCVICQENYELLSNNTCKSTLVSDCLPNCINCDLENKNCLKCKENYFLHKYLCIKDCPNKTYSDLSKRSCLSCGFNCLKCVNSTICNQCEDPYILYNKTCLLDCPNNFYYDISMKQCNKCSLNCMECYDYKEDNCNKCYENYYLKGANCFLKNIDKNNKETANLKLNLIQNWNKKNEFTIFFNYNISFNSYINLKWLVNLEIEKVNMNNYTYSIEKTSNNDSWIVIVNYFSSLSSPKLKVTFNNNSVNYIKNEKNESFFIDLTNIYFINLDTFLIETKNNNNDYVIIVFNYIFYIFALCSFISFLFEPQRESIFWFLIDAYQTISLVIFIKLDYEKTLIDFLWNLLDSHLSMFIFLGKRIDPNSGKTWYFNKEIEDIPEKNNIFKFLGSPCFLTNGFHGILILISGGIILILLRLMAFKINLKRMSLSQTKYNFLEKMEFFVKKGLISFLIKLNFFFFNIILFGSLIQIKYFQSNKIELIGLIISILAIIFLLWFLYYCFKLINKSEIYLQKDERDNYLSLFKDLKFDEFLKRNQNFWILMKKTIIIFILVFVGSYLYIFIIMVLSFQVVHTIWLLKNNPFTNNFIFVINMVAELCLIGFYTSLFILIKIRYEIEEYTIIPNNLVESFYSYERTCISFVFMINISFCCCMFFIFFNTCKKNLDCICFFLIEKKDYEKEEDREDQNLNIEIENSDMLKV